MKKYLYILVCALSFCFIGSVKAEMFIPEFDVTVKNQNGASYTVIEEISQVHDNIGNGIIPYSTILTLSPEVYSESLTTTKYDGYKVYISNLDIEVTTPFTTEDAYELDIPKTYTILAEDGVDMYEGPSNVFYKKLDTVIPKDTEIEYKYIDTKLNLDSDEKFVYVTYNGVSGWVYITDRPEEALIKRETPEVIAPAPVEPVQQETKKEETKKPSKIEIVIAIGLAVILLLSITSLIALVLINRKNSEVFDNRILENPEEEDKK